MSEDLGGDHWILGGTEGGTSHKCGSFKGVSLTILEAF